MVVQHQYWGSKKLWEYVVSEDTCYIISKTFFAL